MLHIVNKEGKLFFFGYCVIVLCFSIKLVCLGRFDSICGDMKKPTQNC